ncbi:MAG: hypothetical protein IT306_19830 [Chloroflexi bacterium]|nr:hypothetical protein [Chloroflexota bacterium]
MSVREFYDLLGAAARLDETRAQEIVRAARPHTEALLRPGPETAGGVQVTARLAAPATARGGSLIPAWPLRGTDGRVTIEFVADWGAMLAGWCASAGDPGRATDGLWQLVRSGERQWVGIANDVLQLYVPNPPDGTYSMVRHHALMLVAATLWLGPDRARLWLDAHSLVARAFLGRLGGRSLWAGVEAAERGLAALLTDPRARRPADEVVGWLDADPDVARTYREYLGAASLGLAALLATAPAGEAVTDWLQACIYEEHVSPDFNRDRIEAFAR